MWPASRLVPAVLVLLLAGMEIYAGRLRRTEAKTRDRGSLFVIAAMIAVSYWIAFGLWTYHRPPAPLLGDWALWVGAAVALCGVALRIWSVHTLGQYFTYVVKVSDDQPVVETGPYRLLRHPSYAGALLTAIGIGLSLRYLLAPLLLGAIQLVAYALRMAVEERALAQAIGEPYRAYMRRTKRIVPFVW